jgi:hypothetical protein
MNENLKRLKALVAEASEVVANLNKETEDIWNENQGERQKKYDEIKAYLLECVEIAKELDTVIKVKVDIPSYAYLGDPTEVFLKLNRYNDSPIEFLTERITPNGDRNYKSSRAFRNNVINMDLPYDLEQHNSSNFIDNWNQEVFEKRFAAEVERAITEKAEKANEMYRQAVNSQEILGR